MVGSIFDLRNPQWPCIPRLTPTLMLAKSSQQILHERASTAGSGDHRGRLWPTANRDLTIFYSMFEARTGDSFWARPTRWLEVRARGTAERTTLT